MNLRLLKMQRMLYKYAFFYVTGMFILTGIFHLPVSAAEALVPSFGIGKINVRIYTDYFCPPCRSMEPKIEPILKELIKTNSVNITFIDTPFSRASVIYAKHFLYILNEKNDFDLALHARTALIGKAAEKIIEEPELQKYLIEKGFKFKPFDLKATLEKLNNYLEEDKINATPTCIVDRDGKKERFSGGPDIIKALNGLKQDLLNEAPITSQNMKDIL